MFIHNHKVIKLILLIVVFFTGIYGLNIINESKKIKKVSGLDLGYGIPIVDIKNSTSPSISPVININSNNKSSKIQDIIFKNKKNTDLVTKNTGINDYLINVFCSETTNKYIKVASGSGVFLSNPDDDKSVILTNAHVARHLLDKNKKCVGRTKSPTTTTHILVLRYIPSYWLNKNNQYIIGDPDQNSTGEFDFAIIEANKIKPTKKDTSNIYNVLKPTLKLKISDYDAYSLLDNVYIYSYPARLILSKNVNNPLFQKKDLVRISSIYSSPTDNVSDSLLDVTGSLNIDHGSSGGMVTMQGKDNYLVGLSSVLIKDNNPQIVRVVTLKHIFATLRNDLKSINNAQTDPFLMLIEDTLKKKEVDITLVQIFKNIKLTSVLEQYTRNTLVNLNILR